jgi:hypothetical protein
MLMNETVKVQEQVQLTADILSTGGGESSEVKKENNTFLQDLLEKQEDKQDATINYSSKTGSEERIE